LWVAFVVVIDGLCFGQVLLGFPCWCHESSPLYQVLQPAPDPSAIQNFFHFPFFLSLDNYRERRWRDLSRERVISGGVQQGYWKGAVLLDRVRDIQLVGVGTDCPGDPVRAMVLVLQLPAWSFGAPVPPVHPNEVVGLEGWCWGASDVRAVLLPGLGIPHLAPDHLVDLIQALGCGLGSLFLWVVNADF
jgi:hypothetical protein